MKEASRTLICLLFLSAAVDAAPEDTLVAESRALVAEFSAELKGRLTEAMQAGGPVNAISVCHEVAGDIAARVSARSGWQIGRTSLKTRNPANNPDSWEQRVLQEFEARKASGEAVSALEHREVLEKAGGRVFRYMKAIPTAPLCLACHGEPLAPTVDAKLAELYPEDRARGFEPGDIRGAFTLTRTLE